MEGPCSLDPRIPHSYLLSQADGAYSSGPPRYLMDPVPFQRECEILPEILVKGRSLVIAWNEQMIGSMDQTLCLHGSHRAPWLTEEFQEMK